ncbi:MAG: nucleoside recognition domain-containing protein [Veillonellales bacterium]
MINFIWAFLMIVGVIYAGLHGKMDLITQSSIAAAEEAVNLSLKLVGVMCLWLGIMKIAEASGMIRLFSLLLSPFIRFLFPSVPINHSAMGAIIMTLSANMLGMGNAVTPLGIKAMQELQKINNSKETASDAMCTFLALCTTGFTLVPATIIALRSAAGSFNPTEIVGTTLVVSLGATLSVIVVDRLCRMFYPVQRRR